MPGTSECNGLIRFGAFELDLSTGELVGSGRRLLLQGQPFQVLSMLLTRPEQVVSREELKKQLWPADTFVDFDHSLNKAVNRLREALGDSAEEPRFIETLPRRGYRLIVPVHQPAGSQPPVEPSRTVKAFPFGSLPSRYLMIGSAMLVAAAAWTVFRLIPVLRPTPTVSTFLQLTNDGRAKQGPLIVDGSRILFSENLPGPQLVLAEASSRGGETNTKSYPLQQPRWADISRDGSEVLALNSNSETPYAVWIIPVAGGSARRVGTFQAEDATWCPDGNTIVYSTHAGNEIRLVNKDGTSDRKLVTVPGIGSRLRWSPDGRTLRFTVTDQKSDSTSLWQVSADGTGLRPLLPGWNPRASQCCGEWTRDAQHFLFQSTLDGRTDIWEIPEKTGLWPKRNRAPFRLTSGPMNFSDPIQSQDGKKLFVIGISPRAELVRYDSRTGEFVPFMPGLSAEGVTVSNDGQWLTYVSYPDGTVWRCKVDGSEKLQLSFAPLRALLPRWSPDGKQIVFFATAGDQPWKM